MTKFFKRPQFNSDFKAYFGHFRKGIFTILGLVLIAALIVGSFIYGNKEQTKDSGQVAETQQSEQSINDNDRVATDSNDTSTSSEDRDSATSVTPDQSGSSSTRLPSNGPETVANTGPEDWLAPFSGAILYLLWRRYRRSQHSLSQAQLG